MSRALFSNVNPFRRLLCKDADERRTKPSELILLDQLIQVDAKKLEDKTQMLAVYERVFQAQ